MQRQLFLLLLVGSLAGAHGALAQNSSAGATGGAPPAADCPPPVVTIADPSIDFSRAIKYALDTELISAGVGYTSGVTLMCSGSQSCANASLTLNPLPNPAVALAGSQDLTALLPLHAQMAVWGVCNYSALAQRWAAAYPGIPATLTDPPQLANPQGFYFYFGTRDRGPLLEIAHPFFPATRAIPGRSVSKALVAATVVALADAGVLGLDDPLAPLVPALNASADLRAITARHVLTHTSGFTDSSATLDAATGNPNVTLAEAATALAALGVSYTPGTASVYCVVAFQVLGAAVEAATGRPWREIFADAVATPLGLADTHFWNDASSDPRVTNPSVGTGASTSANDGRAMLRMMTSGGLGPDGARVLSPAGLASMTAWSGAFPLGAVDGASVGVAPPCAPGQAAPTPFANRTFTGTNVTDWVPAYGALGLDAAEAADAQALWASGGYGAGLWVQYDHRCRLDVVMQGSYSTTWAVLDADSPDPVEVVFFGGTVNGAFPNGFLGRAVAKLAQEALQRSGPASAAGAARPAALGAVVAALAVAARL